MNTIWLIIAILAGLFVVPCVIYAGIRSKKVATEMCGHCIYKGWEGKDSPCYRCVDCDRLERMDDDA